jgi:hypothetical protein
MSMPGVPADLRGRGDEEGLLAVDAQGHVSAAADMTGELCWDGGDIVTNPGTEAAAR